MQPFLLLDNFVIDEKLSAGSNDGFVRRCAGSRAYHPQAEWEGHTRCRRGLDEFTAIERTVHVVWGALTHLFWKVALWLSSLTITFQETERLSLIYLRQTMEN